MPIEPSDARGGYQITLPEAELERLMRRIEDDYNDALGDHRRRMARCQRLYQLWRQRYDPNDAANVDTPNFRVPLVKWHVFLAFSKMIENVFGDDAEITATPTGPADEAAVRKVARYMQWRVFKSMRLLRPLCVFLFRKILFGRSIAYTPWVRDSYLQYEPPPKNIVAKLLRKVRNSKAKEKVHYEGPGFIPLWPDDIIVPAEKADTIHDFSFVIRKYTVSADKILIDASKGIYNDKTCRENRDRLVYASRELPEQRDPSHDAEPVQREADKGEGVTRDDAPSARQGLPVLEWYGRWRMLKPGSDDAEETDLEQREERESEIVVRFLYSGPFRLILGVQDLADLYPKKRRRRPFAEAALVQDGTYWCEGLGEMLEEIQHEVSNNENFATLGGMLGAGPVIFYRPSSASTLADRLRKYGPFELIPVDNPKDEVFVVTTRFNPQSSVLRSQTLLSYAERLDGLSDLQSGRQPNQANAPKTVGQTVALIEEGNSRLAFDAHLTREDLRQLLNEFWELEADLAPDTLFFRVTEEEAAGLFDVRDGGSTMDRTDRTGEYDFDIRFATSAAGKAQRRNDQLALYQLDLGNPLIVNNPRAMWKITARLHEVMGDLNFQRLVPEPPEDDLPLKPNEEHVRILQGETVEPRPGDNDHNHLIEHDRTLEKWRGEPPDSRDDKAIAELERHYVAQMRQMQQKKLMQAMMQNVMQNLPQLLPQLGQPGAAGGGGDSETPPGGADANGFESPGFGAPAGPVAAGLPDGAGLSQPGGLGV